VGRYPKTGVKNGALFLSFKNEPLKISSIVGEVFAFFWLCFFFVLGICRHATAICTHSGLNAHFWEDPFLKNKPYDYKNNK
jgi:hypothetical protein